jgi:thiol-disulfide isomerase/thioredoxin
VALALALLLLLAPPSEPTRPGIGDPAPALELPGLDGRVVGRVQMLGRVTLVEFFATWCGPCRASRADLAHLRADLGLGFQLLQIDVRESPEVVGRYLRESPAPPGTLVLLDRNGEAMRRFGADRLPTTFLVDARGVIRHINRGHGAGYRRRATRWLQRLLAEGLEPRARAASTPGEEPARERRPPTRD